MSRDVFLCHASEDKPAVIRPLAYELERKGISCWLDEVDIRWGQSIIERVSEGLRTSRFVIVVLSRAFLSKNWPHKDLAAVLSQEISSGQVRVLPLLVGAPDDIQFFLQEFPLLHDKLHLRWDGAAAPIVRNLQTWLEGAAAPKKPEEELLICGRCRSAFQNGVHVCLGCRGSVVYGPTSQELADAVRRSAGLGAIAGLFALAGLPGVLNDNLELVIPAACGLSLPVVAATCAAAALCGAWLGRQYMLKTKGHLVRTFPP